MTDHPLVRASRVCPLCYGDKDVGLVACWPCYRAEDLKWGNTLAERTIDGYEALLAEMEMQSC